jgi:hypothetical protein
MLQPHRKSIFIRHRLEKKCDQQPRQYRDSTENIDKDEINVPLQEDRTPALKKRN